eukprot:CAMPEP_0196765532 /NCGR_PEP_ID=MMETSP1095-20130614/9519_1 /TAXON_ID=96789 ORGANISM="Chromulina nebulosa, Strain UTEXLB2642" /NCGR_SAMPLE_ID=MMETSP1095 /ASSEMBLY_ACC=CAM_ASM_000446 /LENGTH=97 /DNA_ID=CAMNT_0042123765 /DNA_START=318 /DNA_END=611 /DNA_ORIENTATION=+
MAERGYCTVNQIDPEDPKCARVTISGEFIEVTNESELSFALNALYERHPAMVSWPVDHNWKVHKIDINEIWLIDIYGGASFVDIDEYYAVDVNSINM